MDRCPKSIPRRGPKASFSLPAVLLIYCSQFLLYCSRNEMRYAYPVGIVANWRWTSSPIILRELSGEAGSFKVGVKGEGTGGVYPSCWGHWGCAPGKSFKLQMHAGGFQGIFQTKLNTMTPAFMPVKFRKVPKRFRFLTPCDRRHWRKTDTTLLKTYRTARYW
jgi:hypothetical protein